MEKRETRWAVMIVGLSLLMLVLNSLGAPSALRTLVNLSFLLLCPGMAFVLLLKLQPAWFELMLGVALSLALDALVAGVMAYTAIWSPAAGMWILAGVSLAGVAIGWFQRNPRGAPAAV